MTRHQVRSRARRSPRKRGPRLARDESKEVREQLVRDVAVELVRTRGLGMLSFSKLADAFKPKLTRTAPLYYFGSTVGLLAAIADKGFEELTALLRERREKGDDSEQTVKRLALTYATYALQNPRLYRAMHSSDLWHAVPVSLFNAKRPVGGAAEKASRWIKAVGWSREVAFKEFVEAVLDAQEAGRLRTIPTRDPGATAHLVTAIVDGFLFHTFEEHVATHWTDEKRLEFLGSLLDLALAGLAVSDHVEADASTTPSSE